MGRDAEERGEKRRERRVEMNSNGLNEHWTASEARKNREIVIRKDERDTVLDEVLQLPQRREQPNGSMYIYVNDVKELRQKVGD